MSPSVMSRMRRPCRADILAMAAAFPREPAAPSSAGISGSCPRRGGTMTPQTRDDFGLMETVDVAVQAAPTGG
jgi:hypothetical protein